MTKEVIGYPFTGNEYVFDGYLNPKLMETIDRFSDGKPILIFCTTKKSTVSSGDALVMQVRGRLSGGVSCGRTHPFVKTRSQFDALVALKPKIQDRKLAGISKTIHMR